MNIIFTESVYKEYIWGGNKLKKDLNKNTPYEKTAESWEISTNKNGISKIRNEEYKERTLRELFENQELREKIFGTRTKELKEFPLLIKFIDAKENLSIQVHPDNEYAKQNGLESGKTEMWYVIECKENAQIIGGLNTQLSKEELKQTIENNKIKEYLNYIDIKAGDSIYIPAGTIHAILEDTLICEIQQNSDTTYRVYDWDRKDKEGKKRQLHKKEAIETIKTENIPTIIHTTEELQSQKIVKSEFFEVEKINCKEYYEDYSDINTFYAINIIEGKGTIQTASNEYKIEKGDSFIIPATLGKYVIKGNVQFLKSYII